MARSTDRDRYRYRCVSGLPVLALLVLLTPGACDVTPVNIRNASPLLTHVGPVSPAGEGLSVVFWLLDHEEDPTDVTATYAVGRAACDTLRATLADPDADRPDPDDPEDASAAGLRPLAPVGGGSNLIYGLASGRDFPGQAQELRWDVGELAADTEVCLYLVPDDRHGGRPEPTLSPTFPIGAGLDHVAPTPTPPAADTAG